jgi:anti-sigma-K factor RskA
MEKRMMKNSMPDDAHVLEQLPALTLGSLEADEAARVQEHLASCMICRNDVAAFENVTAQLAYSAPFMNPSARLKERLMQRVQEANPQPQQSPRARPWFERLLPAWGLASLVLILALGALNLLLWQRVNQTEAFLSQGGMQAVPLIPSDPASPATGFVLVSADGDDGALVVDGLPPLGENQQYQLWLSREGERASGAIFSTDENSYGGTRIRAPRSLRDYSAVGITIEPAGGSAEPTGERVLGGPLFPP